MTFYIYTRKEADTRFVSQKKDKYCDDCDERITNVRSLAVHQAYIRTYLMIAVQQITIQENN